MIATGVPGVAPAVMPRVTVIPSPTTFPGASTGDELVLFIVRFGLRRIFTAPPAASPDRFRYF